MKIQSNFWQTMLDCFYKINHEERVIFPLSRKKDFKKRKEKNRILWCIYYLYNLCHCMVFTIKFEPVNKKVLLEQWGLLLAIGQLKTLIWYDDLVLQNIIQVWLRFEERKPSVDSVSIDSLGLFQKSFHCWKVP